MDPVDEARLGDWLLVGNTVRVAVWDALDDSDVVSDPETTEEGDIDEEGDSDCDGVRERLADSD